MAPTPSLNWFSARRLSARQARQKSQPGFSHIIRDRQHMTLYKLGIDSLGMAPSDRDMVTIVGIDVGGTKTAVVEGTCGGRILNRREILTQARCPFNQVFPKLAVQVESVMDDAQR